MLFQKLIIAGLSSRSRRETSLPSTSVTVKSGAREYCVSDSVSDSVSVSFFVFFSVSVSDSVFLDVSADVSVVISVSARRLRFPRFCLQPFLSVFQTAFLCQNLKSAERKDYSRMLQVKVSDRQCRRRQSTRRE